MTQFDGEKSAKFYKNRKIEFMWVQIRKKFNAQHGKEVYTYQNDTKAVFAEVPVPRRILLRTVSFTTLRFCVGNALPNSIQRCSTRPVKRVVSEASLLSFLR